MKKIRQKRTLFSYFIMAYVLIVIVFSLYRYYDERSKLESVIKDRLHSGAAMIKFIMPDGYFDRAVAPNSISFDEYKRHTKLLSQATWEGGFKYLYAFKEADGKYYLIASSITRKEMADNKYEPFWLEYTEAPKELIKAHKTHKMVYAKVSDRWGKFYSVFNPEYSPSGEYYIVGADFEYHNLKGALSSIVYSSALQALILLFLLFLIYVTLSRMQKHYISKLQFSNSVNEASPIGVMSIQPDGTIEYVNPVLASLIGLQVEALEGNNIRNDLGFYKNDALIHRIRNCLHRQISWQGEFQNISLSGKEYWVNAIINYITPELDGKAMLNIFAEDVTSHMKSRISLGQHNKVLKFLSEAIHTLLANPDLDKVLPEVLAEYGKVLVKNRVIIMKHCFNSYEITASWMYSSVTETGIPMNLFSQTHKPFYTDWEASVENGEIVTGESYDFPLSLMTLTRISNPGVLHLCPILCDDKYWGFLITLHTHREESIVPELEETVLRSITDSIGSALKRNEINQALLNSVDAKTRFLSSMSHEIRTPLNGVVGMINLLESTKLTSEQKEYIDSVRASGRQLMNLINNILDISRIEAGKTVLRGDPINLTACIQAAVNIVNFELKEKKLALELSLDAKLPSIVKGDETRLKQIIVNLLHNSIKFTNTGTISVSAERLSKKKLKITIADTGIGMTKEQVAHVFEPFYQAGSTAQNLKGTGLGLAIAKQLVEMMHGKIIVESEPDRGTSISFTVELPILEDSVEYAEKVSPMTNELSSETEVNKLPIHTLLLLGHDLDDKVLQSFMFSKGYNHVTAENWDKVLSRLDLPEIKLIIVNMPETSMQNNDVMSAMKQAFRDYKDKYWLVLTPVSCEGMHDADHPYDRVSCQTKPLDFDKILIFIQMVMQKTLLDNQENPLLVKLDEH